jgi:hypothetical protein
MRPLGGNEVSNAASVHPGSPGGGTVEEKIGRLDARAIGKLVNDELFFARKSFGMFGQIYFVVVAVDRESIWVRIGTSHDLRDEAVVTNIRNAILNYLQDILPCRLFRATYSNPTRGVKDREFVLSFDHPGPGSEPLASALILTELADPRREAFREQMAGVVYPEPSEQRIEPEPDSNDGR